MLTEKNIKRMWDIDAKSHIGLEEIPKEDKEFYNAHFDIMLEMYRENYEHWQHHTCKFRIDL